MKKRIIFLTLTLVLALSGCTSNSDIKEEIEITHIEVEEEVIQDNELDEEIGVNFDKEKITGEISKIVGNIVTLDLYEIPERSGDGSGTGSGEKEDSTTEINPLVGTTAQTTGKGGMKSGGGSRMTSFEKSGETREVIIPVGISIKSSADPDMSYEIENLVRGMSVMVVIDAELTDAQEKSDNETNYTYASSVNIIIN
ncbi:MAG: hypothetical protein U9N10_01200 [Bacillota bacterium]|nr:hypothetical protein [Bacillota bacterium]